MGRLAVARNGERAAEMIVVQIDRGDREIATEHELGLDRVEPLHDGERVALGLEERVLAEIMVGKAWSCAPMRSARRTNIASRRR